MIKAQKLDRIAKVEEKFNCNIDNLMYQLHWGENMMHKGIAKLIDVPRSTVTRWFHELDIPTQSCCRFTNKNLTSWLYKTGKLQRKPRYEGPDRRLQRTKGNVDINFFKKWSAEMAYVLGFFAADGGMFINSEGSKYIQFVSTDKDILTKIKNLIHSNHKISVKKKNLSNPQWAKCYLIQIGSREMYDDLSKLGFTPKKDLMLQFPKIPNRYLSHFVRGYFDGDGSVSFGAYKRKSRNNKQSFYILTRFVSGSRTFLSDLSSKLRLVANIGKGYLGYKSDNRASELAFSVNDSKKLFKYMYNDIDIEPCCYLERKYNRFQEAFRIFRGRGLAGLRR
ncbi:MAG: LAGLIDADG family homing endonuclease [Candidatus Omnitrophota bacterium]